jgi:hypothetical protein
MLWPPIEGEDIVFLSMVGLFPGKNANLPTIRKGSIALVTEKPL